MTEPARLADGLYRPDFRPIGTVYTEDPDEAGTYTVVDAEDLWCALISVSRRAAATAPDRTELAGLRELHWQGDYEMLDRDRAEVEIAGQRWHPISGTFDLTYGPTGEVFYRFCDVTQVQAVE